jgi:hypothetical protein
MVRFSVFNELSLPIQNVKEFEDLFKVLNKLRELGMEKIRMDKKFTQYSEILPDTTFEQLLGQIIDRTQQRRLKSFISNSISIIETPLIKEDEKEQEELLINEYFYNSISNDGGLACSDIWNTIAVSFLSNEQWDTDNLKLQKQTIVNDDNIQKTDIDIRHTSKIEHLESHQEFFNNLEIEKRLNITQENFWKKREEFFPNKIVFCKELEEQIKTIDRDIFYQAINILRDIETDKKLITDYSHSGESQSVRNSENLKRLRYFTIENEKIYFDNHLKFSSHRIYFTKQDGKIYIGYIGKHLPTKRF